MTPVKYHEAAEEELLHEIGYLGFERTASGDVFEGRQVDFAVPGIG